MQALKTLFKKTLGVHYESGVTPLKNLTNIGSSLHGYNVPTGYLNKNSVCYCIGAGEDISFDTELMINYDCEVVIFDPAPEGINHFNLLTEMTAKGQKLTVGHADPFTYRINSQQLSKIVYKPIGIWNEKTTVKFYKPDLKNYASHSIELFHHTGEFIEVPVDRLKNLAKELGHTSIDLIKMEIEGAEYVVIDTIVDDKIDVKIVLVEFDEVFHAKDARYLYRIKNATDKLLKAGYKLVHSTPHFKRLFVRDDIYRELKSKEK